MADTDPKSEDRAIDALMAAAFRLSGSNEPLTEKESEKLAANPPRLSPEDEAAIESLGTDFVHRLLHKAQTEKSIVGQEPVALDREIEEAYASMNRGKHDDSLSEQTRHEIERKRRELLGEEEPEDEDQNGSQRD